jgi:hypothetical protein
MASKRPANDSDRSAHSRMCWRSITLAVKMEVFHHFEADESGVNVGKAHTSNNTREHRNRPWKYIQTVSHASAHQKQQRIGTS